MKKGQTLYIMATQVTSQGIGQNLGSQNFPFHQMVMSSKIEHFPDRPCTARVEGISAFLVLFFFDSRKLGMQH